MKYALKRYVLLACLLTAGTNAPLPALTITAQPVAQPADAAKDGFINFNFNQVDIRAFVELVGKMTGKKFVLGDKVTGTITVVSPPVIPRSEVYPLFLSVLESSGFSMIKEGDICTIVPLQERATPAAPVVGAEDEAPQEGLITKVILLNHVTAAQMAVVLESMVGGGKSGTIGVVEETNHLVITDTAPNIRRIQQIIREIDRPGLARGTEVVPLVYASAEELAVELSIAVADNGTEASRLKERLPAVKGAKELGDTHGAIVVASPHANSLLLVGTPMQIQQLKDLIKQMDVDAPSGRGRFNAIFLKYLSATEASTNINALLAKMPAAAGSTTRSIAVEASVANNALLVDSSPGDFEVIHKLVDQLDKLPEQVHINVMIAEVTASTNNELGIQMVGLGAPGSVGALTLQGSSQFDEGSGSLMDTVQKGLFPKGLTVGVAQGSSLDASGNLVTSYPGIINIDAIRARGRFEILSETALEAQNNKQANVSVVNEIPILDSTIQGGGGTSRDVIQNLKRVDVGIKLNLTPHIIPGGDVQMVLNPSIEAVVDPGLSGAYAPTIAKREVSTTVTVKDGSTIVIAGLTRQDKSQSEEKVPFLGSIPILGHLFKRSSDSLEKTDLLILVTPHVIANPADAASVMDEWSAKTDLPIHGTKKP